MKKKYLYNLLIVGLCLVLGACNGYLDEIPQNKQKLSTTDDYDQLLNNAYLTIFLPPAKFIACQLTQNLFCRDAKEALIQMIPVLGLAPIILALTGDIAKSRIVIAAILTFYPVAANTLAGFKSVQKEKHELMYSYAAGVGQFYFKTMLPACLPYFFTGLKIAAPMAITASILVDTLQGGVGLGCLLSQSLKGAMTRYIFWQIIVLSAVIGVLSFVIIGFIEKLICRHRQ